MEEKDMEKYVFYLAMCSLLGIDDAVCKRCGKIKRGLGHDLAGRLVYKWCANTESKCFSGW